MKDIPNWLAESLSKPPDILIDAPMPDIYTDECDTTVPQLNILEPDTGQSTGFNPYDTGVFQKK
jgi:hypothetical protein